MARLQQPFNAQAVDPTQKDGFVQMPLGKHPVVIVASDIKPNSKNDGGMIAFELQIIGGPNQGTQTYPWNLNLYSANDQARQISETQFSALCHATGQYLVEDTAALHNKPFAVEVTEQKLTAQQLEKQAAGERVTPFTQVRKILDANGNEPKAGGAGQAAQGQAGWGGAAAPAEAPAAAPAPAAGGWGGGAPAQQAAPPAPAAAPAAAGWSQGGAAGAGGAPAWGKK